jgi:ribosome maturation factor RimP
MRTAKPEASEDDTPALSAVARSGTLAQTIEEIVKGFSLELVEIERSGRGLLRVTIDRPVNEGLVSVEDCERVTRQLQYTLEVDNVEYSRLEVGSPGTDRLLRTEADLARFMGERVLVVLAEAFNGRKRYSGELKPKREDGSYAIEYDAKPRATKKELGTRRRQTPELLELVFAFHEAAEIRLDPVLNFKPVAATSGSQDDHSH